MTARCSWARYGAAHHRPRSPRPDREPCNTPANALAHARLAKIDPGARSDAGTTVKAQRHKGGLIRKRYNAQRMQMARIARHDSSASCLAARVRLQGIGRRVACRPADAQARRCTTKARACCIHQTDLNRA